MMKCYLFFIPLFGMALTGCDMAHRINESSYIINQNTDAVDCSTQAIYRNLEELKKIQEAGA